MRQVTLLGRAGSDGELKYTPQGRAVFTLSICVTDRKMNDSPEEHHWFDVNIWNKSAEIAKEQVKKGCEVFVSGKLSYRSWKNKDGQARNKIDINADVFRVTQYKREAKVEEGASDGDRWGSQVSSNLNQEKPPYLDEVDLPF